MLGCLVMLCEVQECETDKTCHLVAVSRHLLKASCGMRQTKPTSYIFCCCRDEFCH
jgi:hypothetical protein